MRIISGKLKGRHISPPKNFSARPTTDFAKESLFNVLNNIIDFEQAYILDLFSGTGSISYEFISRGAGFVVAVEVNNKHASFIRDTARDLKLNINIVQMNAFLYIKKTKQQFDVIFCDPPYQLEGINTIPELVFENNLLKQDGWLIIEHSSKINFNDHEHFFETRNYGSVHFSFFKF